MFNADAYNPGEIFKSGEPIDIVFPSPVRVRKAKRLANRALKGKEISYANEHFKVMEDMFKESKKGTWSNIDESTLKEYLKEARRWR